jgi:hypothetical protein
MAEVLAPIGSTSTMTILHPQDAYSSSNQAGLSAARRQMPRNSMYNPQLSGYRGPSSVPISPYAFQATPQLKQDVRPGTTPTSKQPMNQQGQYARIPYQDSSASSTSSTSSSSNRSAGPYALSKDDSVLGTRQRHSMVDTRTAHNMVASLSTPDLSLPSHETVRPSPDRYKRFSRSYENTPPPPQQGYDASPKIRPVSAPLGIPHDQRSLNEPPNVNRLSMGPRQGSFDDLGPTMNATRYKRRSGVGRIDASTPMHPVASPINASVPTWSQVVAGRHNFQGPLPPPAPLPRPQHTRSSSYSEVKNPRVPKPMVVCHFLRSNNPISVFVLY